MTLRKAWPSAGVQPNADDMRYNIEGLVIRDSNYVPRSGIFLRGTPGINLVSTTSGMTVNVGEFSGVAARDGGAILISNDGVTSVAIAAAPASNSRLDVIYAKQNDSTSTVTTPDANNNTIFGVLQGVVSGSPVRNPSGLPAGAIELATIVVPSSATATNAMTLTNTYRMTSVHGGEILYRNQAEMLADISTNGWGPSQNDVCRTIDNGVRWRYFLPYNATTNPFGTSVGGTPTGGWFADWGQNIFGSFGCAPGIPSGTEVQLGVEGTSTWTEYFDGYNFHSSGTSIIPPFAGRYQATLSAQYAGQTTGARLYRIRANGTSGILQGGAQVEMPPGPQTGVGSTTLVSDEMLFNGTSDYLDITTFQSSGGTLQILARLSFKYLGPPVGAQ